MGMPVPQILALVRLVDRNIHCSAVAIGKPLSKLPC